LSSGDFVLSLAGVNTCCRPSSDSNAPQPAAEDVAPCITVMMMKKEATLMTLNMVWNVVILLTKNKNKWRGE
jgi:hypothetical protein